MYDVIVVGARCAGASLALFLGRKGVKVLLIDRFATPVPTLSTHIIGETDVYARLGILEKMENAGAPPLTRFRVDLCGTIFESDMLVTSRALGLRREILDPILLDAADACDSVTTLLQANVVSMLYRNGEVAGVRCRHPDGTFQEYLGRIVVGADGRHSMVASCVNPQKLREDDERHLAVLYAYVEEMEPLPIPAVEWYWVEDGVMICNPIDQSMHCIAIMQPKEKLRAWQKDLSHAFYQQLMSVRTFAPRLKQFRTSGPIRGAHEISSYIRHPFGKGWALVGDAGAHLHPIAGVGIDNAVCTAEILAEKLTLFLEGRNDWDSAMEEYARLRDERLIPQYEASLATLALAAKKVPDEQMLSLQMLSTFPSHVKKIGMHASTVLNLMQEVEKS